DGPDGACCPDVREDMNCNAKKLEHCSGFLDEDEQHLIISMLNGSWSDDLSQKAELTHVCSAGCCRDRQESVQKVKKALQIALRMCATPLLYRWKHVSPMAEMVLRGLLIHNLWPYVWRECMREKHDVEVEIPETADDPNLSPAEAQKIRSAKVLQMLESPDCIASFARAVLLVRPLRLYVDFVSLVETVRLHRRLRRKGLLVAGSGTRHDENDLVHMNLQLVTGRRGLQVCVDFLELLRASPDQEENQWNAEVNLDHDSTVPSVLMAMCDAFRRLHACFLGGGDAAAGPDLQAEGLTLLTRKWKWGLALSVLSHGQEVMEITGILGHLETARIAVVVHGSANDVYMKYVLDGNIDDRQKEARFQQVKSLLRDILIELPASSVEIEKMHANTLLDNKVWRQEAKGPSRCQMDTYTTGVSLEHEQLKMACEQQCLGKGRRRTLRLLQTRLCDSSGPNNLGLNVRRKRKSKHLEAADDEHAADGLGSSPQLRWDAGEGSKDAENQRALVEKDSVSRQWQRATAEEKAEYQRQADSMQAAREEVLSQSLSKTELDEHPALRKSQISRLHHARLGHSVQDLSQHPVWDSGLKVAGHNSPLKEEHVLLGLSEEDLQQKHKALFGFDPTVVPNPQRMPTFHRSCRSFCAGLCRCNENFETVVDLVRAFEQSLQARKLSGEPMVLSVQPIHGEKQWVFLGCVCKRPMLQHVVVHLWARTPEQLSITVKDGAPQISTMHQILETQIRQHVGAGRPRDTFRVEVYFFPDCSCGQIDADLVLYPRDDKFSDPIVLPHDTADPPNYVRRAAPVRGKLPFGIGRPPQKPAKRSATGMKKQKETQGSGSEEEGEAPVSTASAAHDATLDMAPEATNVPSAETRLEADDFAATLPPALARELLAGVSAEESLDNPNAAANASESKKKPHGQLATAAGGGCKFQATLGIIDVGPVLRKGVSCYNCGAVVDKGCLKFTYAFKKNKPARSIHTSCLPQIPKELVQASVATLENLVHGHTRALKPPEASACHEALRVLSGRVAA
ncbi:unnamed protein product, partial [Symbiodinium sp. KB8]